MANAKSVFESGIEKGETYTCVSQLGKTQCLTKLRHMSHQAEKGEKPV